jgi:galactokinase
MALTFWAPGRVNLIGEHTDYSGGLVLPVAIHLGIELSGTPAERISLVSEGEVVKLDADGTGDARGWGRYVAAVAKELAELGRPAVGLEGVVEANLPRGAGLGSSGALEVVVALALCAVADFELEPLELARACQRAEQRAVGVPSGILDQAASLLGREGQALLLDCGTLERRWVDLPAPARDFRRRLGRAALARVIRLRRSPRRARSGRSPSRAACRGREQTRARAGEGARAERLAGARLPLPRESRQSAR